MSELFEIWLGEAEEEDERQTIHLEVSNIASYKQHTAEDDMSPKCVLHWSHIPWFGVFVCVTFSHR